MRQLLSYALTIFAGCLLATCALAQPPDGYARSRTLDVDEPGWTATRLDAATAAHLGVDLTVLSPDGKALRVYRLGDQAGRRGVRVTSLERGREDDRSGRWVRLDLGAEPPRHVRLEFVSSERTDAPDCVLQSSDDGRSWDNLARGGLFRLGDDAALQRMALDYPASTARHMRLFWPDSAGTPALERVSMLAEGDTAERIDVDTRCDVPQPGRRTCGMRLAVPARQARRLELRLTDSDSTFGWRLWSAQNGSWRLVAGGVRQPSQDADGYVVRITLDERDRSRLLADAEDPSLRLELWAEGNPPNLPPNIERASLWAARPGIAFEAERAGRHVVVWAAKSTHGVFSDGLFSDGTSSEGGASDDELAWVEAADAMMAPWPAIDERLAGPGKDFDASGYSTSWPVEIDPGAKPGNVVRLELGTLEAGVGTNLMRLSYRGRLLPFIEQEVDEPSAGLSARFHPEAVPNESRSAAKVTGFDASGFSQLILRAPGPFRRSLSLSSEVPGRRGRAPTTSFTLRQSSWECLDSGPLPCVLDQTATVVDADELELEVKDGDDLPLPWVDIEQWRPRAALLFVIPRGVDGEPVRLHLADPAIGDPRPGTPRFDLDALAGLLRLRAHVPARLGAAETTETSTLPATLRQGLLYGAVGLAVLVLLAFLGRMLRESAD